MGTRRASSQQLSNPSAVGPQLRRAAPFVAIWAAVCGILVGASWGMMRGGTGPGLRFGLTFFLVSVTMLAVGAVLLFVIPDFIADILAQTPRARAGVGPSVAAPSVPAQVTVPAPASATDWAHFVDDLLAALRDVLPEAPAFHLASLGGLVYVSEGVTTVTVNVAAGQFPRLVEADQIAVRLAAPVLRLVTSFVSGRVGNWPPATCGEPHVSCEAGVLLVAWCAPEGSAVLELPPVALPMRPAGSLLASAS